MGEPTHILLRLPAHVDEICVGGQVYAADGRGTIRVPATDVAECLRLRCTPVGEEPEPETQAGAAREEVGEAAAGPKGRRKAGTP